MNTRLAIAALIIGGTFVPIASFATDADSDRSHPKAFVKDSAITVKIKSKLAAEHITSLGRIHVDTDADGIVYLSGTARSQQTIDRVVEIARNTEHVVDVKNELRVRKDD